jgi:hypothetical protein
MDVVWIYVIQEREDWRKLLKLVIDNEISEN